MIVHFFSGIKSTSIAQEAWKIECPLEKNLHARLRPSTGFVPLVIVRVIRHTKGDSSAGDVHADVSRPTPESGMMEKPNTRKLSVQASTHFSCFNFQLFLSFLLFFEYSCLWQPGDEILATLKGRCLSSLFPTRSANLFYIVRGRKRDNFSWSCSNFNFWLYMGIFRCENRVWLRTRIACCRCAGG